MKQLDDVLRHPLIGAIIGSIVGSWLIPWVVGQSQRKAAVVDARVKQGIEIMITSNIIRWYFLANATARCPNPRGS